MVQIVVDAGQARQILDANEPIEVVGPEGRRLGFVRPGMFTPEEVQEAVQRANDGGPWYTTEQVLAHLQSLEKQ